MANYLLFRDIMHFELLNNILNNDSKSKGKAQQSTERLGVDMF